MNKYIGFYWPKYCKEILEWFQEKYTYYINTMLIICKVLLRRVVASWLWLEKRIESSFENVSDTVVFSNISPSIVPRASFSFSPFDEAGLTLVILHSTCWALRWYFNFAFLLRIQCKLFFHSMYKWPRMYWLLLYQLIEQRKVKRLLELLHSH